MVKEALERAGLLSGSALLAYMGLEEPGECVGGGLVSPGHFVQWWCRVQRQCWWKPS